MKLRLLAIGALLGALAACTPQEHAAWLAWRAVDPAAAEQFAEDYKAAHTAPEPTQAWTVNWDAIARCESGGQWDHPPVSNRYGTFSGGLMWNHRYWLANGGGEYAQEPWQATKEQQIAVSEAMVNGSLAAVDRAWQCY